MNLRFRLFALITGLFLAPPMVLASEANLEAFVGNYVYVETSDALASVYSESKYFEVTLIENGTRLKFRPYDDRSAGIPLYFVEGERETDDGSVVMRSWFEGRGAGREEILEQIFYENGFLFGRNERFYYRFTLTADGRLSIQHYAGGRRPNDGDSVFLNAGQTSHYQRFDR